MCRKRGREERDCDSLVQARPPLWNIIPTSFPPLDSGVWSLSTPSMNDWFLESYMREYALLKLKRDCPAIPSLVVPFIILSTRVCHEAIKYGKESNAGFFSPFGYSAATVATAISAVCSIESKERSRNVFYLGMEMEWFSDPGDERSNFRFHVKVGYAQAILLCILMGEVGCADQRSSFLGICTLPIML